MIRTIFQTLTNKLKILRTRKLGISQCAEFHYQDRIIFRYYDIIVLLKHRSVSSKLITPEEEENLLIPLEDYLKAGVHIGTSSGMKPMQKYIYRVRNDGLFVLDVRKTDERIRIAAKFIARHDPSEVVVASVRTYGMFPVIQFASVASTKSITGRFVPGTFTNPNLRGEFNFHEPKLVIITDPNTDRQALKEANMVGIPVVSLADTDNTTLGIDYVIPCNNKGRNSLATVFWLLARETLRERGELTPERDNDLNIDNFRAPRGRKKITETDLEL